MARSDSIVAVGSLHAGRHCGRDREKRHNLQSPTCPVTQLAVVGGQHRLFCAGAETKAVTADLSANVYVKVAVCDLNVERPLQRFGETIHADSPQ